MNLSEARARAAAHISEGVERPEGFAPVIVDEDTLQLPWGWVFFYNSRKYVETGEIMYALAGNAPVVVTHEGHIHETGTSRPLAEYLSEIQERLKV